MLSRRKALTSSAVVVATGASLAAGVVQAKESQCAVYTSGTQGATTPDQALNMLKAGNERFASGKTVNCDLMAQVKATSTQQSPVACVVGCIDSRVPPELVFDQRLGDIFAARVAGNFVNTDIIGSLEFATKIAGAKAIVVIGHTECGAVKGAVDDAKMGNLTATLANIRPSMAKLKYTGVASSKNKELVQQLADQNAKDAAANLLSKSEVLSELVKEGKLKIASGMYDIGTGKVTWFS